MAESRVQVVIKGEQAMADFSRLLVANGYTVRIAVVVMNGKKTKVVEFWKE